MLQAEINGKISDNRRIHIEMEDILTSDVFGVFKYLDNKKIMIDFLRQSEDKDGNKLTMTLDDMNWKFCFWPKLNNEIEPDLLLQGFLNKRLAMNIVVEAKYNSCKNIYYINNEKKDQLAEQYKGMIKREWKDTRIDKRKISNNYLIYITNNFKFPTGEVEESIGEIKESNFIDKDNVKIFWLSWRKLIRIIDKNIHLYHGGQLEMLRDLRKILKKKRIEYRDFNFNLDNKTIYNWEEIKIFKNYNKTKITFDFDIDYIDFKEGYLWTRG